MPAKANDGRKQLGSRVPVELLKHLRTTAVARDTTVTELVVSAVTAHIGPPPRNRKKTLAAAAA